MRNDRAERAAEEFMHFCNGANSADMKTFVEIVTNDHRTLQQIACSLMMKCVESWAKAWVDGHHDARNEMTCKAASITAHALDMEQRPDAPLFDDGTFLGLPYV